MAISVQGKGQNWDTKLFLYSEPLSKQQYLDLFGQRQQRLSQNSWAKITKFVKMTKPHISTFSSFVSHALHVRQIIWKILLVWHFIA